MATDSSKYLATLHQQIDKYFSFAEVRTLCFELGVDYENIPGNMKSAFIRNMIVSLARKGQLQEMVDLVRMQRPHIPWENVPVNFSLPESVASEDLQQVVQHNYYGDVVHGNKYGGDHIQGDKFSGDKVTGDKVGGDQITVGDISGAQGVAIGGGASASVQETTYAQSPAATQSRPTTTSTSSNPQVQRAVDLLQMNLGFASPEYQTLADELNASIDIILNVAGGAAKNDLHIKLLGLGQQQLAIQLKDDVPGVEGMVARFITAVS